MKRQIDNTYYFVVANAKRDLFLADYYGGATSELEKAFMYGSRKAALADIERMLFGKELTEVVPVRRTISHKILAEAELPDYLKAQG